MSVDNIESLEGFVSVDENESLSVRYLRSIDHVHEAIDAAELLGLGYQVERRQMVNTDGAWGPHEEWVFVLRKWPTVTVFGAGE